MDSLTRFISDPANHDTLALVKGFRNGIVYGAKIRFPHALVMTFLFREGPLRTKFRFILDATRQHSWNLGRFVLIYKTLLLVLRKAQGNKESKIDAFIAGTVGGYLIFGENNNINQQIVLYLFSRIMIGLAKLAVKESVIPDPPQDPFPMFAAVVWGIVMWLFRHNRDTLQSSLQASMQYLYNDSDMWKSLKTLLWHNK
ncbi:peroxisomal membrane protein 4 [Catenaria anguillulae PL171]|uniref:Peroxisomal membrane protein 4 n=1 Tax=Catenaria anguillulae PL171 TaxID=765915 RepID=A0A1Y2HFA4_9FUNG|nr:peroxisomal membrane protein 4 [Catenaria anguillulae PL171]